ncbi:MAG: hypothetical protein R6V12_01190 [Candidatus Hydrogenedentota bacterium]
MERTDIQDRLVEFLRKKNRDFVPLGQLKKLPKAVRDAIGIRSSDSGAKLEDRMRPHLTDRMIILNGSRTKYLAFNQPREVLVATLVREKPGKSLGQLGQLCPLQKAPFVDAVNALLKLGQVQCEIGQNYSVKLFPADAEPPGAGKPRGEGGKELQGDGEDHTLFARACRQLDRGQQYIRIHELRDALGWPRERFDRILEALRDDGTIQLHTGDISTMSEEEVRKSYVDENNFFLATLTWRES